MEYSKEVKKLLKAIKEKQEENLEEQENYGKKLQEDINELQNKQKVLENDETTLDKV